MKGKVRDFVSKEGIWNWSKFDVFLPPNVLLVIAAIPPPFDDAGEDVVLWGGTVSGSFSIKSAYSLVTKHSWGEMNLLWKII